MGYRGKPIDTGISKVFAWWPIKTTSKKRVWLKDYYKIIRLKEQTFEPECLILNKKEYFLWNIAHPTRVSILPSRKNKISY